MAEPEDRPEQWLAGSGWLQQQQQKAAAAVLAAVAEIASIAAAVTSHNSSSIGSWGQGQQGINFVLRLMTTLMVLVGFVLMRG